MMMTATALLRTVNEPTETEIREAISGNLCRCTGYVNIVKAIQYAQRKMHATPAPRQSCREVTEMTQTIPMTSAGIGGMGHSMKRKEDPRFLQGKGNYVEDVNLPGMLWMDIVRSPYAHAKIVSIDLSKALAIPGSSRS